MMPKSSSTRFCYMSGGTSFFKGDRRLGKKISAWVACSHFNAWQIQHHFKQFPSVIYNGVDIEKFRPMTTSLREQLGINESTFLLSFAGRLVGWKGLSVAIDAIEKLKGEDVKLLIIGAGDDLERLKSKATAKGLAEQVIFHPPLNIIHYRNFMQPVMRVFFRVQEMKPSVLRLQKRWRVQNLSLLVILGEFLKWWVMKALLDYWWHREMPMKL